MVQDTKRILILTADVGFGHRNAANAIAVALEEKYGKACIIEIANPLDDRLTPGILRESQSDYDRMVRRMPDAYKLGYQFSNEPVPSVVIESGLTVLLFNVVNDILKRFCPDAVVVTNNVLLAPLGAVIAIHKLPLPFLTIILDLTHVHRLWFHDRADFLLVPTTETYQQALGYGFQAERVQITGIPVHPNFAHENRPAGLIRAELGWQTDRTTVLVVGSKRVKNLEQVLHVLNHSGLPMQLVIVAGGDDQLFAQMEATDWHLPVHVHNFIDEMPLFMRAADCILSKAGGLIVSESLACGLPMLIVDVTPGQEEGNAEYVVKNGAGDLSTTPVQVLETLFHLLDNNKRLLGERAEKARALGCPRSAYEIAELTWLAAEKGRFQRPGMSSQALRKLRALLSNYGIRVDSDH